MIRRDHRRTSRRLLIATLGLTALVSTSTVTAHADDVGVDDVPAVSDDAPGGQDVVESGVDDGGSEVAVGLPPVPPDAVVGSGVDDGGNVVAVGLPPVPPVAAVETGVDDGGNVVAVGQPPVPPADDDVHGARRAVETAPAAAAASTAVNVVVEQMFLAGLLLDRQV